MNASKAAVKLANNCEQVYVPKFSNRDLCEPLSDYLQAQRIVDNVRYSHIAFGTRAQCLLAIEIIAHQCSTKDFDFQLTPSMSSAISRAYYMIGNNANIASNDVHSESDYLALLRDSIVEYEDCRDKRDNSPVYALEIYAPTEHDILETVDDECTVDDLLDICSDFEVGDQ